MFHFALDHYRPVPEAILSGLISGITNKLKFIVCYDYGYFFPYGVLSGPETLLVTYNYWNLSPTNVKMLTEILNKRWQTLDLKSMVSELQRSSSMYRVKQSTLSSVYRFKRKQGASSLS